MTGNFNNNVKTLRLIKNISQAKLSEGTGIERSIISRIENGQIETSISNAFKISEFFKVPLADMIYKEIKTIDDIISIDNELDSRIKQLSDEKKRQILDIIDVINK